MKMRKQVRQKGSIKAQISSYFKDVGLNHSRRPVIARSTL